MAKKYAARNVPVELFNEIERQSRGRSQWELFLIYIYKHATWGPTNGMAKNQYKVDLDAIARWVCGVKTPSESQRTQMSRYVRRAVDAGYISRQVRHSTAIGDNFRKESLLTLAFAHVHQPMILEKDNQAESLKETSKKVPLADLLIELPVDSKKQVVDFFSKIEDSKIPKIVDMLTEMLNFLDSPNGERDTAYAERDTPTGEVLAVARLAESDDGDNSATEASQPKLEDHRDADEIELMKQVKNAPVPYTIPEGEIPTLAKMTREYHEKRKLFEPQEFIWMGVIFFTMKSCYYDLGAVEKEPQMPKKKESYVFLAFLRKFSASGKVDGTTAYWLCNAICYIRDQIAEKRWNAPWTTHVVFSEKALGNAYRRVREYFNEQYKAYAMPETIFNKGPEAVYELAKNSWITSAMAAHNERKNLSDSFMTELEKQAIQRLTRKVMETTAAED